MKKVLLVEDDFILALVHRKYLEKINCEVVDSVASGEEAIQSSLKNSPDFILMDIRLEGSMDGIEAMIEIQKQQSIPVIYVTGNSEPATIEKAKKTNMIGFLVKPLHLEELKAIVDKI